MTEFPPPDLSPVLNQPRPQELQTELLRLGRERLCQNRRLKEIVENDIERGVALATTAALYGRAAQLNIITSTDPEVKGAKFTRDLTPQFSV
jgi:hypothetical protein